MNKKYIILSVLLLTACDGKARECQDEKTLDIVKQIVWEQVNKQVPDQEGLLNETVFKSSLLIEHPRPTSYDETIKKYTCAGSIRYVASGLSEFGKLLDENGSRFVALKNERKASVKSPLRYNALSLLSDNPYILNDFLKSSDAMGYIFQTEFTSQKVGDEDFASVAVSPANLIALYAAAALSAEDGKSKISETVSGPAATEKEPGYELSGQEKGIIAKALADFQKTMKANGVVGVIGERDKCYQAASAIKEKTLTLQCIAYDYGSSAIVSAIESSNNFPKSEGFLESDVRIRALESIENTISEKLSTTNLRETFIKGIQSEVDQQIAHEVKDL